MSSEPTPPRYPVDPIVIERCVNDAVLIPWAYDHAIARVVAVTDQGCAVAEYCRTLRVEDKPCQWPAVGYFLPKSRTWFDMWCGCEAEWVFFPSR